MILVDISSILHRMIFGSTKNVTVKADGQFKTEEFIKLTLHLIISELIQIQIKYNQYDKLVICFDDFKKEYWRRDIYPQYKGNRRALSKEINPIKYNEVYKYTNELFDQFTKNLPWKCVYVNRAEADDIILILAKEFHKEGILIHSPDKDFIQCQRNPNVVQWSSLTNKWILPENKNDNMNHWIAEHCLLGDSADGVPKVVDHTVFSEAFDKHLTENGLNNIGVFEFKKLSIEKKKEILSTFTEQKYNKKGQEIGLDIYSNIPFGDSHIQKIKSGTWRRKLVEKDLKDKAKILRANKKLASKEDKLKIAEALLKIKDTIGKLEETIIGDSDYFLDDFLDSNPLYREHYDRNFILVMEEGIPDYIRANVMLEYNEAKLDYNEKEFNQYLDDNGLGTIKTLLPKVFKSTNKLDLANCGW